MGVEIRILVLLAALLGAAAIAVGVPPEPAGEERWKLDRVELKDGRVLQGLLEGETEDFLQLLEVRRPAGRPLYALGRTIPRSNVKALTQLTPAEREVLQRRLAAFIARVATAEKQVWSLSLTAHAEGERTRYHYAGTSRAAATKAVWFTADSTADDEMTRRSIVRLEQMFATFRQQFPPLVNAARPPHFLLYGTMDEYAEHRRTLGLQFKNPAYYSAERNEVVAGSDLSRFARQLTRARAQHQQVRQQYAAVNQQLETALREKNRELEQLGVPPEQRANVLRATRGNWDRALAQLNQRIQQAERLNAGLFQEVAADMFGRLSHEAFHAYLDNYLFPRHEVNVPPWLNEGLAQLFEAGIWEGETFRVDAPQPRLLRRIQAELERDAPLRLEELLSAGSREFLVGHGDDGAIAAKFYAAAWALAYDLVVAEPRLTPQAVMHYVRVPSAASPTVDFEKLIGQPLTEFEPAWRARVVSWK